VFEVTESFLIRLNPVWTVTKCITYIVTIVVVVVVMTRKAIAVFWLNKYFHLYFICIHYSKQQISCTKYTFGI